MSVQDFLDASELSEIQNITVPVHLIRAAYLERDLQYNPSLGRMFNKINHLLNQSQRNDLENAIENGDRQAFYNVLTRSQLLYLGW